MSKVVSKYLLGRKNGDSGELARLSAFSFVT